LTQFAGIVGAGNISETHARAAQAAGVKVAAVTGRNIHRVEELARRFGAVPYGDFREFLAHRPMDFVVIGSPSGLHAEQGIAAAEHGLHVLVEKPIDISTERADSLILSCEKAGRSLGVIFQDRTKPGIKRLKLLIDDGQIGRPILASAEVRWYRPPEYYGASRWRGTWALDGGGALMNQGIHTVDLMLWLLGDVVRVYAKAITGLHKIETEDTVVATIEFATGAIGTLEATTAAFPGYDRRIQITGSKGTVTLERDNITAVDLATDHSRLEQRERSGDGGGSGAKTDENQSAQSPVVSDITAHCALIEDFARSIETGTTPLCDGVEGRRSLAVVRAIYESSRTNQPVELSATS